MMRLHQRDRADRALPAFDRQPERVCFISPLGYGLYRPESGVPFGGAEVQFFLLAKALSEDPAFEVSVLTTVQADPGMERYGALSLFKRQGMGRLGPRPGEPRTALRGYLAAFADMYRMMRRIDADVYLHAGAGVEVGAYALISRLLRRRFIFTVASSADLDRPCGQVPGPLRWLFPIGLHLADAVVCRTEEQQACLKTSYGCDGILIRTAHPMPSPHSSLLTPHSKFTVLWVGRAHPLKQPELFLNLAERVPGERCVMVMMRDAAHETLLKRVRERVNQSRNVELYEDVPLQRVEAFFDEAALLVNTSTYEGFPNTFVQAAMRSIPILSWTVDPDGVLSEHEIGVCAGGSLERFVASAQQLCRFASLRGKLGQRAGAYARAYHDLDHSSRRLKTLICSLIRSARA